jgi:mevalonate kinase
MEPTKQEIKQQLDTWLTNEARANLAQFGQLVMDYHRSLVEAGASPDLAAQLVADFQRTSWQAAMLTGRQANGG